MRTFWKWKYKKINRLSYFGNFSETNYNEDKIKREHFIKSAGEESISVEQLEEVIKYKRIERNVELIKGDITKTIPEYIAANPELKIALLNLDTDIYSLSYNIRESLS